MKLAAGAALIAIVPGCSWFLMDRHEKTAAGRPLCTTTKGWAALDGVAAVVAFGSAGITQYVGQSAADVGEKDVGGYNTATALLIIYGALHGISGLTGIGWASSCRDDIDAFEAHGEAPATTAPMTGVCFQIEEDGVRRRLCGVSLEECDLARDDAMRRLAGSPISACYDATGPVAPMAR